MFELAAYVLKKPLGTLQFLDTRIFKQVCRHVWKRAIKCITKTEWQLSKPSHKKTLRKQSARSKVAVMERVLGLHHY